MSEWSTNKKTRTKFRVPRPHGAFVYRLIPVVRHDTIPGHTEATYGVSFDPHKNEKCDVADCERKYKHIHLRRDAPPATMYEELLHMDQPTKLFGEYSKFGRTREPTIEDVMQYVLNPAEVEAKTFAHAIAREKREEGRETEGEEILY